MLLPTSTQAYERLLDHNPEWRGKVVLVQMTNPPRSSGRDITELHEAVTALVRFFGFCHFLDSFFLLSQSWRVRAARRSCTWRSPCWCAAAFRVSSFISQFLAVSVSFWRFLYVHFS